MVGVTPLPMARPEKFTFQFSTGQTLVLEGEALRIWWAEYAMLIEQHVRMQQFTQSPAYTADSIREALGKKKENGTESKG